MREPHPVAIWAGLAVLLSCGLAAATVAGAKHGWVGYVIGFPLGLVAVIAIPLLLMWVGEALRMAGPALPPCHAGRCRGARWPTLRADRGDYQRVTVDGHSVFRCQCGREYEWGEYNRRFMERFPDGTLKPYMVHRNYRGWFRDDEAWPPPAPVSPFYCPRCGREMQERRGVLTCIEGEMPLSPSMQETLRSRFPTQEPRSEDTETGFRPGRWFCPGCGVPLVNYECPKCGKSLLKERFALLERHPHKTEDGGWG